MGDYDRNLKQYDDIINLPHHQSKDRPHMSLHDRAAQFAPFAALTGHEEAIEETARLTEEQIILDETSIAKINETLYFLSENLSKKISVAVTYFKQDQRKQGGAYLTDVGAIKKIEQAEGIVVMDSGMKIPMKNIVAVEPIKTIEDI